MAVVMVCATFPLIWVGGLVTTYDAGMAVPDWPSTYGYNLFLYPWQTWLLGPFDLFIEHGHRLLGAAVGMIAIVTMFVTWRYDQRKWVCWFSVGVLAMVIVQGLLGGLRVTANEVQVARIHGIVGPAFFAMTIALAAVTSRLWRTTQPAAHQTAGKLHRLAVLTTGLVFIQLILGAHLRHLPLDWSPYAFRAVVIFHLLMAAALFAHIVMLAVRVFAQHRDATALMFPVVALCVLIVAQVVLGSATWIVNYSWPDWAVQLGWGIGHTVQAGSYAQALTVTAHQAMGSLILGVSTLLTIRAYRLLAAPSTRRMASISLKGVLA